MLDRHLGNGSIVHHLARPLKCENLLLKSRLRDAEKHLSLLGKNVISMEFSQKNITE